MTWIAALAVIGASVAPAVQTAVGWREAPEFVVLFAPAGARAAAYRAYVSAADLDAALGALAADPTLLRLPGAWEPAPLGPGDAFGMAGRYDRTRLRRLYGALQPRVARGARRADDGTIEAWTLVSPYPSADMQRLERGTLLLVLRHP